jgi:DNA replication protein DnaC
MDNLMPTFFTSNLDFATLEQFYSLNGKEPWPAKRVMERVKALGQPIQLKGRNHRNDY